MPWPLVLPLALIALLYGVLLSKKEEKDAYLRHYNKLKKKEKQAVKKQ